MPHSILPPFWLLILLACSGTASAHRPVPAPMPDLPVSLELIDHDSGRPLPAARHRGQQWVAGRPGQAYAVRLHNRSGERLLVVLSVDGINAISGETADPRQAGYVLEPGRTADIGGWRKSLQAVAGFVFVDPGASYAARTGRPHDVGVVGIAVHRERSTAWAPALPRPRVKRVGGEAAGSAVQDAAPHAQRQRIGTGHGAVEASSTWRTRFDRDPTPLQIVELRYDTPSSLRARGVRLPDPRGADRSAPRAFPDGFVPDPPR